jgi:hypothetical protein
MARLVQNEVRMSDQRHISSLGWSFYVRFYAWRFS